MGEGAASHLQEWAGQANMVAEQHPSGTCRPPLQLACKSSAHLTPALLLRERLRGLRLRARGGLRPRGLRLRARGE